MKKTILFTIILMIGCSHSNLVIIPSSAPSSPTIETIYATLTGIADAYITPLDNVTNQGSNTEINVGTHYQTLIKFNISNVQDYSSISDCQLALYIYGNDLDYSGEGFNITIHLINQSSYSWDESTVLYLTRPTGTELADTSLSENKYVGPDAPLNSWSIWNITDLCVEYAAQGYTDNISFFLDAVDILGNPSSGDEVHFYSAEFGTDSLRPYLNITYIQAD